MEYIVGILLDMSDQNFPLYHMLDEMRAIWYITFLERNVCPI